MIKDGSWLTSLSSHLPDLFERLPFAIAIVGDDGRLVFANREFKDVFPEECPVSRSLPLEVETPGHGIYELRAISLDGLKAVVGRDISEVVESRRQLAKMEKLVSFGQIASGVTDELSTALACGDAQRASDIVHRFLGPLADAPKSLAVCNLNSVVENVLQTRTSAYKTRNILVTQDLQADLPSVLIDVSQIQQVLLCLLLHAELNSGKASSVAAHIHIRSITQDDRVRILISSSSGSKIQERADAGLNLDFSAEIVSRYGGRLSSWRNAEAHSTLMLELPATELIEEEIAAGGVDHRDSTHLASAAVGIISAAVD